VASFQSADLGMRCGFELKEAKDADEVMAIAAAHEKSSQGVSRQPADLGAKIKGAIKG
jgi:predicted small metal-binding protein